MKNEILRLRLDSKLKTQLRKAIKDGKAETMSQLVRQALREFLQKK
jgi:Arc/MetJ-type ribon-helix-helix transcriptional regulator